MKTQTRISKILSGLESRGFDFETASEYGEPGYSTDKPLIIFGNWNDLQKSTIDAIKSEMEMEWDDEWLIDGNGRAFRQTPDCYSWRPSFFVHDGEVVAIDSLTGDVDELRYYGFIFEPGDCNLKSVPENFDLSAIAEMLPDEYVTGLHPGQNDNPEVILKSLPMGEYAFRIDGKGQFDCSWSIWKITAPL